MRAILLLAAAAPLAAAPVPKEFKRQVNYHPMAVGDKREYVSPANPDVVTQVREITAVEEKGGARFYTQTIATSGQTNVLKTDKTGTVSMASQNGEAFETPYKVVAPDMKEGDTWACNDPTGMTRTVGKPEKITVPAGTYTAYPITCSYPAEQGQSDVVVWYADGVGLVRLDSGGRTSLVLKKYTPGKDAK
jgi:hypothetical protein